MIEINEKNIPNENNMYLLKALYLMRKSTPISQTFLFVLFFTKYLGVIVNSRIIEMITSKGSVSLNKYLKNLFLFGQDLSVMHRYYFEISIFGAILILCYYIYFMSCFIYMRFTYKNISSIMDEQAQSINKNIERILYKILSYVTSFLIFFHQYIVEYFAFGIYGFIYNELGISSKIVGSKTYSQSMDLKFIDYLENGKHIPVLIISLIVIILLIVNFFFFMWYNSVKGLFLDDGIFYGNRKYIILKMIMFHFQPFFILTKFYNDETNIKIGIIFNIIIIVLCLISLWNSFYLFGYYPNNVGHMCLFLEIFVFLSSITEIIVYYIGYNRTTIFFFVKLFVEIINSFIFTKIFLYFKDKNSCQNFAKNLFSKNNTDLTKSAIYYYMRMFLEYQKNKNKNYLKLFKMILLHIKQCKKIDCPGNILISKDTLQSSFIPFSYKEKIDWKNNIFNNRESGKEIKEELIDSNNSIDIDDEKQNLNVNNNKYNDHITLEKKKMTEKQFQIIFEQEIMNKIEYFFKTKKYGDLESFIFIHLQYLYKMKKNYSLTLYYVGKYSKCGIKWTFLTQYYLYEYKRSIINSYYNKLNINNVDKAVNKYRKDNLFMKEIINYFIFLALLKNLIISSCDKLKALFNFRKNLHNPLILKTYKFSNTNTIFKKGEELRYNIDKILSLTKTGLYAANKDNISAELSYIISNFLLITLNKIPDELRKLVNPNFDINSISSKLESGYKFFNLVHPLILTLTKNNTFNIAYVSCVISNRLGFLQHELKDKDFHEKLFPGVKFIKQHELLMKHFLFFSYNSYAKANTFIKSKEGYLIGVSIIGKKFPTFYEDFFYIIGIDFNERLFYSKINKCFNRYSFLLDENMEFIAETKNFLEEFEFNIGMFRDIKTNFLEFFCVDKNSILDKIKKKSKDLLKNEIFNISNFKREEDAFALFKNISYEKAYELRDLSKLETLNKNYVIIYDKIEKDKIIKLIPELNRLIEEYGLDFEWYQRLQNLSDRLLMRESKTLQDDINDTRINTLSIGPTINIPQGLKNTMISTIGNTPNPNLNMKNIDSKENLINNDSLGRPSYASISSMSKKNFGNKIMSITFDRNFDVVYNLKKMGSIYFYIIDLYEKVLYLDDNFGSPKKNYSFHNKKIFDKKGSTKKVTIVEENNKLIKAKTIFHDKLNIKNKYDFPQKIVLIDEESNKNNKDKKNFEKMKTWEKNKSDLEEKENNEGEVKSLSQKESNANQKIQTERKSNLISQKDLKEGNKDSNSFRRKSKKDLVVKKDQPEKMDYYDNQTYYNYRNNKDDDEELISLISKDQIEELRKKNYYFNKIYIIILMILFAFSIIVISIKLYYASTNFSFILNLTSSLIFFEEIKSDIYAGSVIIISQCLRREQNDIPYGLNDISLQLMLKGADLITHLNAFEKQLNLINDDSLLSTIRKLLYKNLTILHLNKDWSQKNKPSFLVDEINYFAYLLNSGWLSTVYNETRCDFDQNFFYLSVVDDPHEIYEITKQETSFNQNFIYYVLENVVYEIQPVIIDILEQIMIALVKKLDSYITKIIIIYGCMAIIILSIEIIYLIKNNSDINFIKQIFLFLYNYENTQLKKEFEISYLENVAKEFNINNLMLLEKIKKDNNFFFSLINSNNLNEFSNNNEESNIKNNEKLSITDNKYGKRKSEGKIEKPLINNYQKMKNDLDQNSMNGSMLNNSINNNSSMVQLINKNNNKNALNEIKATRKSANRGKITKKNKVLKQNKIKKLNEEEKIFKENEDVLELLKSNRKIVPLNSIISIYASIVLALVFVATLIISLFDLYKKSDLWEYAVNLSMNYLEKVPKVIEIGFTAYLSAILGKFKAKYYTLNEYKSHQNLFLTFFLNRKGYDKSELISTTMNASYFMNKLYDNYRLKKNLEFCENDVFFRNHFKETKYWIKKLDEKNSFCVNAALGSALFYNKQLITVFDYFTYVDQMAYSCREEGEKLDESGLDLEIDFILQELTYSFNDFQQQMKTNLTLARNAFFGNQNNLRILKNLNVPFTFGSGVLYLAVDKDMKTLTNYISRYELIFISITFIIDGLFLLYIFWTITFIEKDKNTLIYIARILQKE